MIRNANREEVKVKPRDTGGKRRRGGSGWEESSHLSCQLHWGLLRGDIPNTSWSWDEADNDPAGSPDFLPRSAFLSTHSIFSSYPSVIVVER
jgi:hypothetical protein